MAPRPSVSKKLACGDLFRQDTFPLRLRRGWGNVQGNLAAQGFRIHRTCRWIRISFGGDGGKRQPGGLLPPKVAKRPGGVNRNERWARPALAAKIEVADLRALQTSRRVFVSSLKRAGASLPPAQAADKVRGAGGSSPCRGLGQSPKALCRSIFRERCERPKGARNAALPKIRGFSTV